MKIQIHKLSQLVTVSEDVSVSELEDALSQEGLTMGYRPAPSSLVANSDILLFDCIAKRVPNLFFLKYGALPDLCAGVEWLSLSKHRISTKVYPRSATGPDLRRVFIGSDGILGSLQQVTLRVFSKPEKSRWCLLFAEKESVLEAILTKMLAVMLQPLFVYLGDEKESVNLCVGLKIKTESRPFLAIKLSGLSSVVDIEKNILADHLSGEDVLVLSPTSDRENLWLNQHLMTTIGFYSMTRRFPHLFGYETTSKKIAVNEFKDYCISNSGDY